MLLARVITGEQLDWLGLGLGCPPCALAFCARPEAAPPRLWALRGPSPTQNVRSMPETHTAQKGPPSPPAKATNAGAGVRSAPAHVEVPTPAGVLYLDLESVVDQPAAGSANDATCPQGSKRFGKNWCAACPHSLPHGPSCAWACPVLRCIMK